MICTYTGHTYQLANVGEGNQVIQFIEKDSERPGGPLTIVNDGTTNEEVLRMLIDRVQYLNSKVPCRENSLAITKLEEALHWLKARTEDRNNRGVEGTDQK